MLCLRSNKRNSLFFRAGSLRKQPTSYDAFTGFPAKRCLRNERRNSTLMTCQESASDWLCREGNLLQPIKSATQIWVVTRHQMGFLRSFPARHFDGKPVVASQANSLGENKNKNSRKYGRGNYRSKWNLNLVDEGDAEKSGEYTKANGEEAIATEGRP